MTRKCVLCKETNYKNTYSFFSAPKDPDTRRKWQEAIGIENYTVSDDTYVCSKHFMPSDIITHWVSGVPPHVVTIKYKKCRLRPGAVPTTSCEAMNNMQIHQEEEFEDFEVNRCWGHSEAKPNTFAEKKEFFLIPREDKVLTYNSDVRTIEPECDNYSSTEVLQEQVVEMMMDNQEQDQVLEVLEGSIDETVNTIYIKAADDSQIVYIADLNCEKDSLEGDEEVVNDSSAKDRIDEFSPQKQEVSDCDEPMDMWECVDEKLSEVGEKAEEKAENQDVMEETMHTIDPLDGTEEEAMLFEDLLDVYTEVPLPRGWSSMVISKGRATTVIYAFMTMIKTGVPYIEKQIFLKSDMVLRCSTAGKEINPRLHNLIREGRQLRVQSLLDVEDIVEEFDQRVVCEGSLEKINPEDIDNTTAFRDGFKWRHVNCPLIINNGSTRCSKCTTLNIFANRRRLRKPPQTAESAELLKKDRTIFVLQKLLSKMSKKNQRMQLIKANQEGKLERDTKNQQKTLMNILTTLNIPKIQKVMIKECIRPSLIEQNGEFSETWSFLSLLLYIQSPKTYKYLLVNKFINLPPIKVMRSYLQQIKTDTQFYKLFQRTVEPFQVREIGDSSEPT